MTPEKAARILRLVTLDGLSADDVRAAFAAAVKATHPDTSAAVTQHAGDDLQQFRTAKEVLLKHVEQSAGLIPCNNEHCVDGQITTRSFSTVRCPTCAGSGFIRKKEIKRG